MKELALEIPPFILRRRVLISSKNNQLTIRGIDVDGTPVSLFKNIDVRGNKNDKLEFSKNDEGFFKLGIDLVKVNIKFQFFGHYLEPDLNLEHVLQADPKLYELNYDPKYRTWAVSVV